MLHTEIEENFKAGQHFFVRTLHGTHKYPITLIYADDELVIYYEDGYEYDKIKRKVEKDSVTGKKSICIWHNKEQECRLFPEENIKE